MKVLFSRLAVNELEDASDYYTLEQQGLGDSFRSEVQQAIRRILRFPLAWPVERGEVRKTFVHRFPYKILYSIEPDHLFIIAIAHQHRKPDYWVGE
jgi:plasmid stabilization system protein ParE